MKEALKMALEALERSLPRLAPYGEQDWLDSKAAITAIKAALEAKDEPMHPDIKKLYKDYFDKCFRESSPPQRTWVSLTDEEMMQIYIDLKSVAGFYSVEKYARAIETKLKEKNT